MTSIPNRRAAVTVTSGPLAATVSFVDGHPFEVFFTARGKSGTDIDTLLSDLGIVISKAMQDYSTP